MHGRFPTATRKLGAMRKLWPIALLVLAVDVSAGEVPIGSGCSITSSDSSTAGSSASDADCVWSSGTWLMLQCDVPVYYRADGTTPTSASPKVTFPGDPYPIHAQDNQGTPLKVLAVSAAATCYVYKYDNP